MALQTIFVPQTVCSYRCAFSAPRVQKKVYFSPISRATGHVGQMQLFSSLMHMKLFPVVQKRSSFPSFAHRLYDGHVGQVHIDFNFSTAA